MRPRSPKSRRAQQALDLLLFTVYAIPIGIAVADGALRLGVIQPWGTVFGVLGAVAVIVFGVSLRMYARSARQSPQNGTVIEGMSRREYIVASLQVLWFMIVSTALLSVFRGMPQSPAEIVLYPGSGAVLGILTNVTMYKMLNDTRKLRRAQDRCERCGYSLVDTAGDACPECNHDNTWRKVT